MKKLLTLFLALIMVLSMVACGKEPAGTTAAPNNNPAESTKAPEKEVKYKERVIIGYSIAVSGKDPHANGKATDWFVFRMTHDTLVDYDEQNGKAVPDLAESWDIDDTGTVYTFHLRKDVKFHNGDPFTSKDVLYSFERMKEGTATKTGVKGIVSVEAPDDYTVKITLDAPNAEFLLRIGISNMCIVDEKAITADAENGTMIGTGAYEYTELKAEEYCLLTRNENYWGEMPPTKEIMFRYYKEASPRAIALQTGEIDVDLDLAAIEAPHIDEDPATRVVKVPTNKLVYIAMNICGTFEPLNDVRVRQALNYATDSAGIILAVREGNGMEPNGVIPVGLYGYSDKVNAYKHDVEKAKALLKEAGYENGVDVQICATGSFTPIFEVLQSQWAEAGINLTLQTSDSTIYSDLRKADEHWMGIHQYNFTGVDQGLRTLWYTDASSNHMNCFKEEIDKMLDDAVREMDPDKRLAKYADISQYLTDMACFLPLYQDILTIGERANVTGAYYSPVTNHNFQNIAVILDN